MSDKSQNCIYSFWYQTKYISNFGDMIGPYIIDKLTGSRAIYVPIVNKPIISLIKFCVDVILDNYEIKYILNLISSFFQKNILVTIGSVIGIVKFKKCIIWGAGISERYSVAAELDYRAVRGKISQTRLKELGRNPPAAIGDPSILLPLFYKPQSQKKYKLGILPHISQFEEVKNKFNNYKKNDILIIDLLKPVELVIEQIYSCEVTISSSLHGLIVSHIYDIPSLWYKLSDIKFYGDGIKFYDYFSSVNIPNYKPFDINFNDLQLLCNEINDKINSNLLLANINCDLRMLQKGLLDSFPFPIINKIEIE